MEVGRGWTLEPESWRGERDAKIRPIFCGLGGGGEDDGEGFRTDARGVRSPSSLPPSPSSSSSSSGGV